MGFYEGKYYSRCLATFHSLRPEPSVKDATKKAIHEENWKSIQTSHCYSAVIGSAYRLHELDSVLKYYDECRSFSLFPNFLESMMVAQTIADSEEYKDLYNELQMKKEVIRGVPEMEK